MNERILIELVDRVLELYPPERITRSRERTQAMWERRMPADRLPFLVSGMETANPPELPEDTPPFVQDAALQLQWLTEHAAWDDDFIPGLAPGIRQALFPSYFGCTEEHASDSTRTKPAIVDPEDVYRLPEAGFDPGTIGGEMLDKIRFFVELTRGELPVYEPDIQGPFSTASQIWGVEDFLLAIYESPEEARYLIDRCTDVVIDFMRQARAIAGKAFIPYHCPPALWYPSDKGLAYSEDLMAVVSPEVVREFMRPSVERIAQEFGGVVLHSCGYINQLARELSDIPGLVGLNFATCETDLPLFLAEADPRLALAVHNSPVSCRSLEILGARAHVELCARAFARAGVPGMCVVLYGTRELDPRVHSPEFTALLTDIFAKG